MFNTPLLDKASRVKKRHYVIYLACLHTLPRPNVYLLNDEQLNEAYKVFSKKSTDEQIRRAEKYANERMFEFRQQHG